MSLHLASCRCEACNEKGALGYPAMTPEVAFPTQEQWNRGPMRAPRWGLPNPWDDQLDRGPLETVRGQADRGLGDSNFAWDPSDFGSHLGQAFVPGTVNTVIPETAWTAAPPPGPISAAPFSSDPSTALAQLTAQGQGPSPTTGIAPTVSFSQAVENAAAQGLALNSDGTLSSSSPPMTFAQQLGVAVLVHGLIYLILK